MLDWSQELLAEKAEIAVNSIRRFEKGKELKVNPSTILALRTAFEKMGVEFIGGDGNVGVILHKSP
jgi:transcriptional regulator with XRE-family HTH domain